MVIYGLDGDIWIRLDAIHLEKLPDGSITKWLRKRLEDKGLLNTSSR